MNNMDTEESQIPRKLAIVFTDNGEEHCFEADVTGFEPEEIQIVTEDLVDEMLKHVGLLEVARYEMEEEEA